MSQENLRALQKKWYKKLRDEGFVDIEHPIHQHTESRYSTWYIPIKYAPETIEATQRYYELAGQLLFEYKFKTPKDKKIWALHSAGISYKDISVELDVSVRKVQYLVEKLAKWISPSK